MAKNTSPTPTLVPAKAASKSPTKLAVVDPTPTTETKREKKLSRADRPTCAAVRKEANATDHIHVVRAYDGRQGTLRANIVQAIIDSVTVWDACKKVVHGPGKFEKEDYQIKKVDIGFALGNGYIKLTPAK